MYAYSRDLFPREMPESVCCVIWHVFAEAKIFYTEKELKKMRYCPIYSFLAERELAERAREKLGAKKEEKRK